MVGAIFECIRRRNWGSGELVCGLGAERGEGEVGGGWKWRWTGVRLILRLPGRRRGSGGPIEWFKVNQAVFQKFGTGRGGIVSA